MEDTIPIFESPTSVMTQRVTDTSSPMPWIGKAAITLPLMEVRAIYLNQRRVIGGNVPPQTLAETSIFRSANAKSITNNAP